jgi:hypothetical protein
MPDPITGTSRCWLTTLIGGAIQSSSAGKASKAQQQLPKQALQSSVDSLMRCRKSSAPMFKQALQHSVVCSLLNKRVLLL